MNTLKKLASCMNKLNKVCFSFSFGLESIKDNDKLPSSPIIKAFLLYDFLVNLPKIKHIGLMFQNLPDNFSYLLTKRIKTLKSLSCLGKTT